MGEDGTNGTDGTDGRERTVGMNVLVCGAGKSGRAAALLARREGAAVTVADEGEVGAAARAELEGAGCRVEERAERAPEGEWGVAVASPGLDVNGAFLRELAGRGVRVESEIEFGWRRWGGRTLAVTGSNGKTGVVKALAEALEASGERATACGNYGKPVCEAAAEGGRGWLVVEASSFQLETVHDFRPDVALVVNLLPNHLDRHGDMETYGGLKARLFARQGEGDAAVVPAGLEGFFRERSGGRGRWTTFGAGGEWTWAPGRVRGGGVEIGLEGSYFDNEVLGVNAAGLAAAAMAAGVEAETLERTLKAFQPLGHRGATVLEAGGVRWVDDSKATNLAALIAAVRMQGERRVRLIAGGRPKESDFSAAAEVLRARVSAAYLIGEAGAAMAAAWREAVPCRVCGTLEAAVEMARAEALPGESVVLAPGCTSYDQFASYGERGEAFARLARGRGLGDRS